MRMLAALLGVLLLGVQGAAASVCRDMMFEGKPFSLCEVTQADDLRLFHSGPDGYYGSFGAVNAALAPKGERLGFAMNAGMYHPDRAPVGLYIEEGQQKSAIATREGPGNFGMLPNGVFCIGKRFWVVESRSFAKKPLACRFATQSGPMLVIKGKLHPRLMANSDSEYIRNGVGVSADGKRAVFAISDQAVNFHAFARLFRDALGLPNALYFDGKISRLYAPELGRNDLGFPMGPMVGTVVPKG
jgi:uncharacterized protein YigE (DUF2233 family)